MLPSCASWTVDACYGDVVSRGVSETELPGPGGAGVWEVLQPLLEKA